MGSLSPYQPPTDATPNGGLTSVGREQVIDLPRHYWAPSDQRQSVFLDGSQVLFRHKWLFLAILLCGGSLGYLSTIPRAPVYRARTLLDIQPLNENFFNMKANDGAASAAPSYINAESFLQTQIKLLQSDTVVERVVKRLWGTVEAPAPPGAPAAATPSGTTARTTSSNDELIRTAANFRVRAVGATRLVEVLCDGSTPALASTFCNTLSSEFIASSLEVRSEMAQRTSEWLIGQLADLRKNLATSEEKLQSYAREAALISSPDRETIAQERLRNLQNELTRAQADRMAKQAQYELAVTRPVLSLRETSDSPVFREYSMRLTELQRQRADLAVSLTSDHPRILRLDAQIVELQTSLQREQDQVLARAKNERDSSLNNESLLQAAFSEQFTMVSGQAEKAVTYNMLRREVESERQLYEVMLQRVREAGFASAMRDSTIRVVDPAKVPTEPISPSVPASVAGGLALGCLLGLGAAFLRDSRDSRIRRSADISVRLGVPELGVIPAATPGGGRLFGGRSLGARRSRTLPSSQLTTVSDNKGVVAEAFRATMNSVLFATNAANSSRVIVVTSPGMRDGKTTLSVNLAAALAETGRRVALVDADMRKPRIHDIIGVDNDFGLHDVLASDEPLDTLPIDRLTQSTEMQGLWVMPSGTSPNNISQLLHSKRLEELVARLRSEFDLVVFDTPPVLPVSDARLFGRVSDGVLLVVRGHQTTQEDAIRARNILTSDGVHILGTIFNDCRDSKAHYYYSDDRRTSEAS